MKVVSTLYKKDIIVIIPWAQILAILGLVGVGGPILTLIAVYVGKGQGKGSRQ